MWSGRRIDAAPGPTLDHIPMDLRPLASVDFSAKLTCGFGCTVDLPAGSLELLAFVRDKAGVRRKRFAHTPNRAGQFGGKPIFEHFA
jgi:hypothetical protein